MSRVKEQKSALYYLVEDFFMSLLVGAAMAAVLVMLGATMQAVFATALGAPGVYFLGQRYRRLRASGWPKVESRANPAEPRERR